MVEWIKTFIKTPSARTDCIRLSGGNRRKLSWQNGDQQALVSLYGPSHNVHSDVGAKEDVYAMIREMSAAVIGLIVIPDTFEARQ